eukprot:2645995-Amphidinium_carterae.2
MACELPRGSGTIVTDRRDSDGLSWRGRTDPISPNSHTSKCATCFSVDGEMFSIVSYWVVVVCD